MHANCQDDEQVTSFYFTATCLQTVSTACCHREMQPSSYRLPFYVFKVNRQPVEYVDQWPHLGHIITNKLDDTVDIMQRRNIMAGQINNVLCYFDKLDSFVKLKLLISYCSSLYGSVLWDI